MKKTPASLLDEIFSSKESLSLFTALDWDTRYEVEAYCKGVIEGFLAAKSLFEEYEGYTITFSKVFVQRLFFAIRMGRSEGSRQTILSYVSYLVNCLRELPF